MQPHVQAHQNAYALRNWLRAAVPELGRGEGGVRDRFPEHRRPAPRPPPGAEAAAVHDETFLDDRADAVDHLMCMCSGGQNIGSDGVAAVARALRPNCDLVWDEGAGVLGGRDSGWTTSASNVWARSSRSTPTAGCSCPAGPGAAGTAHVGPADYAIEVRADVLVEEDGPRFDSMSRCRRRDDPAAPTAGATPDRELLGARDERFRLAG